MAVREILIYDHPLLHKLTKRVNKVDNQIKEIVQDMIDTMEEYSGIGLAAPQIGISRRIIVVKNEDEIWAVINPKIVKRRGEEVSREGCLSFPQMIADVKRATWVKLKGLNEKGKKINLEAEGLIARVFQHEIDHLNGILLSDRAEPGTLRKIEIEIWNCFENF